MIEPMTDDDLAAWLTDIDCGCQPTREAFLALARRCAEAEAERDDANWRADQALYSLAQAVPA